MVLNLFFRFVYGLGVNFIFFNGFLCFLGFKLVRYMVFVGVYFVDGLDYEVFSFVVECLICNDVSVLIVKEISGVFGIGFRCGFFGFFYMDVFY